MLGAIIGDVVESRFEWHNLKSKEFALFAPACKPTDDSVMTLAVAQAILQYRNGESGLETAAVRCVQELGRRYPQCAARRGAFVSSAGSAGNSGAVKKAVSSSYSKVSDPAKGTASCCYDYDHSAGSDAGAGRNCTD